MPPARGIDPRFFEQWEVYFEKPLPNKGDKIRVRYKNGDVVTGTVLLVWACMDTVAFRIEPERVKGGYVHFVPEIEDGWEIIGV